MDTQRALRALPAILMAISLFSAAKVLAAESSQLASKYSAWAGGKSNADALVKGLRSGSSITLATTGSDRSVSLAGFTPQARLSDEEVAAALAAARSSLSRLGISRPSAEQIQAALIGGEVTLPNGGTRLVAGSLASGAPDALVATR